MDEKRIDQLEKQIRELEIKVKELEKNKANASHYHQPYTIK